MNPNFLPHTYAVSIAVWSLDVTHLPALGSEFVSAII